LIAAHAIKGECFPFGPRAREAELSRNLGDDD
jgi:hypothetical protein